ncbi:thiolase domain-containing protein [Candidatus Alkanophaga liquidiphilum]
MRRVAVVGAGMIRFGELFDKGYKDMVQEAYLKCLESVDKGIVPKEIDAGWLGCYYETDGQTTGLMADHLGLLEIPWTRVENACASGGDAIRNAFLAVASGYYDVVLVVGAEKMRDVPTNMFGWKGTEKSRDFIWDYPIGITGAANFAMHAVRHMHEYGTTKEQMALVAVKNHKYGAKYPYAHFRREITVEDVLRSPMVAYPFSLLDCCPQTDGAAVILAAEEVAKKFTDTPVFIAGASTGQDRCMHMEKEDMACFPSTIRAARRAYKMACIENPTKEIDVAELHDCFTMTEIITYEDLGFCKRGEGGKFIEEGQSELGGIVACNLSGGLKAKGHPIGATGVAQCAEIFWQLRGEAHVQAEGAEVGLTHNIGGPTAASCVIIYRVC